MKHLTVQDTLRLRQTCKDLSAATKSHAVWHNILHSYIYQNNIPLARTGDSLESLSAAELENAVAAAIRRRNEWTGPAPQATIRSSLPISRRVQSLHFHSCPMHSYLFSDSQSSATERDIDCWDLAAHSPRLIARRRVLNSATVSFNKEPDDCTIAAIGLPDEIELLSFTGNSYTRRGVLPARSHVVLLLSGSVLVSRPPDDATKLILWNTVQRSQTILESRSPQATYIDAIVDANFLVVLRTTAIAIYPINTTPPASSRRRTTTQRPITEHIHTPVYSGRLGPSHISNPTRNGINVLVRRFAGPTLSNTLHHFTIFCNRAYNPNQPPSHDNLPFCFPPTLTQTIGAPLRGLTPASSDLPIALGLYGTAIWADNHVEDYFGPTLHGQRLVGRVLIDARGDDEELSDHVMTLAMAATTYDIHVEDNWTCIAMDERENRLAVGSTNGAYVLQYR